MRSGSVLGGSSLSATYQSSDFSLTTRSSRSPISHDKHVAVQFPVGRRQWISFGAGYMRLTSVPEDMMGYRKIKAPWRYKAIPLSLGYTLLLADENRRLVPVVGATLSYYLSNMKEMDGETSIADATGMALPILPSFTEKLGMGYGGEVHLGLRANIDRHVFVQVQQRVCYVNGLAFNPNSTFDAEFVKVDFSVGLGFRF